MEQTTPNWNYGYQRDSSNLESSRTNGSQISQIAQNSRIVMSDCNRTNDIPLSKRSAESEAIFQPAPKREKVQNSSSCSDRMLPTEQTQSQTLSPGFIENVASMYDEEYLNQESSDTGSFNTIKGMASNAIQRNNATSLSYAISSETFPKITDLLTGPAPEGPYSDSQVDTGSINSSDVQVSSNNSSAPYACSFCTKKFRVKLQLTHHLDTHDVNKTHRCTFPGCERAFRSQKYLDNHMNDQHGNASSRECPYCEFVGNRRSELKRHLSTVHKSQKNQSTPSENSCSKEPEDNGFSDGWLKAVEEVFERNVREIYERRPVVMSPPTNILIDSSANLGNGDHFSPDGTSSTVSAPSFSNGGCMTGGSLATPPPLSAGNLPNCPSVSPGTSCPPSAGFCSRNPPPSDIPEPQWPPAEDQAQFNNVKETVSATESFIVTRSNYPPSQSPYGRDYCNFQPEVNQIHRSPTNNWDPSFQSEASRAFNSQSSFRPQSDDTRLYQVPQPQQQCYHSQTTSTTMIPYRHFERQPYPTEGNSYPQANSNSVPERIYYQDYYQPQQQQHFYQQQNQSQQAYYQGATQRQRMVNAQHRGTLGMMRSGEMNAGQYQTLHPQHQAYDTQIDHCSPTNWPPNVSYYDPTSQLRRLNGGVSAPGVFQPTTTTATHYNPAAEY